MYLALQIISVLDSLMPLCMTYISKQDHQGEYVPFLEMYSVMMMDGMMHVISATMSDSTKLQPPYLESRMIKILC